LKEIKEKVNSTPVNKEQDDQMMASLCKLWLTLIIFLEYIYQYNN
jgi:hypothetical protein